MNLLLGGVGEQRGLREMEEKLGFRAERNTGRGEERDLSRWEGPKTSLTNFEHRRGSALLAAVHIFSQDIKQLEIGP